MNCRVLYQKGCVVTSVYGMRKHPVTGVYKLHNGVDVVGSGFTLAHIIAHTKGTVEYAGYNSVLGYHVNIRTGPTTVMQYNHMTKNLQVKTGDNVAQGQIIGTMGSTGSSTGAHLHFGIQENGEWVDPQPYLYRDYYEKEEDMTQEQFNAMFKVALTQHSKEVSEQAVSSWAKDIWEEMTARGLFDGKSPQSPMTRQQAAVIISRLEGQHD